MNESSKSEKFFDLHCKKGAFVAPNSWDPGSAHLLTMAGFEALETTGAGFAFSKARPDAEAAVSREEVIANLAEIARSTPLPVHADLDDGYGPTKRDVKDTIRMAAAAGVIGGSIEDSTGNWENPIHDFDHAVDRIHAAVSAARSLPFRFFLTARCDNYMRGKYDLKDTISRLQAFEEAGADAVFAPGLSSETELAAIASAVKTPLVHVVGLGDTRPTTDALGNIGIKRIQVGTSLCRACLTAFISASNEIINNGTFTYLDEIIPFWDLNDQFKK